MSSESRPVEITLRVAPEVFDRAPTFRRGVVIATKIDNLSVVADLERQLASALLRRREEPLDLGRDARFVDWDGAHRSFGSNPNKFPPAHKAIVKRVQRADAGFKYINSIVAIMNTVSMVHLLPVGGDDLAEASRHGRVLELRPAAGEEDFTPLGEPDLIEHPEMGEVIYAVGSKVMCRRWNWRNGHLTRITENTRALVMNADGIGAGSEERASEARDYVATLLGTYCGAQIQVGLLSPQHPELRVIFG